MDQSRHAFVLVTCQTGIEYHYIAFVPFSKEEKVSFEVELIAFKEIGSHMSHPLMGAYKWKEIQLKQATGQAIEPTITQKANFPLNFLS